MDTDKNIPNPQYFLMQEAYEQWAWKAYGISQVLQLYHINLQFHQSVLQNVRRLQLPPIGLGWSHFDLHCVSSDGWLDKTSNHIGGICVDLYIVELQGGTSTVATYMVLGEATISRATDIIQSSRMRLLKIFYTTSSIYVSARILLWQVILIPAARYYKESLMSAMGYFAWEAKWVCATVIKYCATRYCVIVLKVIQCIVTFFMEIWEAQWVCVTLRIVRQVIV